MESSSKLSNTSKVCVFCKHCSDSVLYGGLKCTKNINAHYFCLLLSTNIKQSGKDSSGILGFLPSDIRDELKRSEIVKCFYCKQFNATIHCVFKSCKKVFHLPCGLNNGSSHTFNDSFESYCHNHRKLQKIFRPLKRRLSTLTCILCTNELTNGDKNKVFWPLCCKPQALIHKYCVQHYALSAGYYTKCPMCNDALQFIQCCKKYGIFVPQQDASWERIPNAYSELYDSVVMYCSSKICICPNGKTFINSGRWRVIPCNTCGSVGSHDRCLEGRKEFCCDDCKLVCNKFQFSQFSKSNAGSDFNETSLKSALMTESEEYHSFIINDSNNIEEGTQLSGCPSGKKDDKDVHKFDVENGFKNKEDNEYIKQEENIISCRPFTRGHAKRLLNDLNHQSCKRTLK